MKNRKSCISDATRLRVGKRIISGKATFIRQTKKKLKEMGIMPIEICPPRRAKCFGRI